MNGAYTGDNRRGGARLRRVRFVLLVILGLNVAVAVAKIVVGALAGSLAMSADGVHSLLDGASNVVALIGVEIASRPPDREHPYGHQRFETLTTLAIAGFMLLALIGILQAAWERRVGDGPEIGALTLGVMLATMAINIGVTLWERREAQRLSSAVLQADSAHTFSDVLVSTSVLASFGLVALGLEEADLAVTVIIAGFIARGIWKIVRDATLALADTAVEEPVGIREAALSVPGVRGAHAVRSRGAADHAWIDLHIQVDPSLSVAEGHDIATEVVEAIEAAMDRPADVTVHVEPATAHHLRNVREYERGSGTAQEELSSRPRR